MNTIHNALPFRSDLTNENRNNDNRKISVPKSISSSLHVRIDLRKLLTREELFPSNNAELLAQRLLINGQNRSPRLKTIVWLHVNSQSESTTIELSDSSASDLIRCQYVFCRVIKFSNRDALLEEFVSPSFSGKKAVGLIWNLMVLAEIQNLVLVDESVLLPCCEQGVSTSLQLKEIFRSGKSWYQTQGASVKTSRTVLKILMQKKMDDQYARDVISKKSEQVIATNSLDYDRFCFKYLALHFEFQKKMEVAYHKACHFLSNLKIKDLQFSLLQLHPKFPKLLHLFELLRLIDPERSIKSLFTSFDKQCAQCHSIQHKVNNYIVSNKESIFFQYIVEKIKERKKTQKDNCFILSFLILIDFFKKVRYLGISYQKKLLILNKLLNNSKEELSNTEVENLTEEIKRDFLTFIEGEKESPVFAKIKAHSHSISREQWIEYTEEIGIASYSTAVQASLKYVIHLPAEELANIYPGFVEIWQKDYPLFMKQAHISLKNLLDLDKENFFEIFEQSIIQYFPVLVNKTFDKYFLHSYKQEDIYPLFMIAKYYCRAIKYFSFNIK